MYLVVGLIALGPGTVPYVLLEAIGDRFAGHTLRVLGGRLARPVVGIVSVITGVVLVPLRAFGYWRNGSERQV